MTTCRVSASQHVVGVSIMQHLCTWRCTLLSTPATAPNQMHTLSLSPDNSALQDVLRYHRAVL